MDLSLKKIWGLGAHFMMWGLPIDKETLNRPLNPMLLQSTCDVMEVVSALIYTVLWW
jgi:hypothetical protein